MSKFSSHLRLVSSNEPGFFREAAAARFRDMMTEHMRAHTNGTNVNRKTLLATDYLNHFNEVVMLLELLPSAPAELVADLANWQHRTYEEHFTQSGFRDKALAIAAYRHAPADVREAFESVTGDISGELSHLLRDVLSRVESNDVAALDELCAQAIPALQSKLEVATAIINGEIEPAGETGPDVCPLSGAHQVAIDELFD